MALFNFKKALSPNLKNAPSRKDGHRFLAHATTIGGSLFFAYTLGFSAAGENGVTSAEGYPSWKESNTRKMLIKLMGGAAKD